MTEHDACALLKARFEGAGFDIAENVPLAHGKVRFEVDGFDADKRVGYEYLTAEAGDSWDVDGDVIAELSKLRLAGELFIFVIDEADAPDAATLGDAADLFLTQLAQLDDLAGPAKKPAAAKKAGAAKKPATAKKPAAKKPAAKKK